MARSRLDAAATGQAYADGMRFVQFYFGLPIAMVVLSLTITRSSAARCSACSCWRSVTDWAVFRPARLLQSGVVGDDNRRLL